jgi:hypothetical protein
MYQNGALKVWKQQSAIELLTTYSWAFIIIALFAAAVIVFYLAEPAQNYIGSSCNILPELPCSEAALYNNGSSSNIIETVAFTNNLGTALMFPHNAFNATTTGISTIRVNGFGNCIPSLALPNDKVTCQASISGAQVPPIGTYQDTAFVIYYGICNGNSASLCPSEIYKTSGVAAQTFGVQRGLPLIVNFTTSPASGFIVIDGAPYAGNTAAEFQAGNYVIYAKPPAGYVFSSWVSLPSYVLSSNTMQTTTLALSANTALTANFIPSP